LDLEFCNQRLGGIDRKYQKDNLQMKAHILATIPDAYDQIKTKLLGALDTTPLK
jgi:hypothetical protein